MKLSLTRIKDNGESTIGYLKIDNETFCFTLEDTYREVKVKGKTRIPDGTYEIKLRNEGGMTKKYAKKFPFHKGMLWLQDVPNFEWVYIHIGNYAKNTDGCILVGKSATLDDEFQMISTSTQTYAKLYKKIIDAMDAGEKVEIEISSVDRA